MTTVVLPLWAVLQEVDGEAAQRGEQGPEGGARRRWIGELLLHPERSTLGARAAVLERLEQRTRRALRASEALELSRRVGGRQPVAVRVPVWLDPPRRAGTSWTGAWTAPVQLDLPGLRWSAGPATEVLELPCLDLAVLHQGPPEELLPRASQEARTALLRRAGGPALLRELARLDRLGRLELVALPLELELASAARAEGEEEPERDGPGRGDQRPRRRRERGALLPQIGTDLLRARLPRVHEVEERVALLAELLGGRQPRSVLLVGPPGAGKTALVHALVARRAALGFAHTPFWATSGARIVAGQSGFGQWQERCQRLRREASRARAVLHLGDLLELMEVGKSAHQGQGVLDFLRPWLVRGELLVICECTPEQLALLEQQAPHHLSAFQLLEVPPLASDAARRVLAARARELGERHAVELTPAGLDALDRLHRRFATYSAHPARALRFLDELVRDHAPPAGEGERAAPVSLGASLVLTAFGRRSGLPELLLDEARPLDLPALEAWFRARVSGQEEAIGLVVDLLARLKAGLQRGGRPLASLLFAGPTGVGKTETAKALAAWLFGDERRLVRIDMSELRDPLAARRLVGGLDGGEGLLTAAVRAQPFSLVLLDELEKADPSCFDLLLQVLGEGRLTDARGRTADFQNAVVVMTSNLGADSHQRGAPGFASASEAEQAQAGFLDAVRGFFRPELINRIDRLVAFAPLSRATVQAIAGRELQRVALRPGLRLRAATLGCGEGVAAQLAEAGYDPRWGARHLQRALERQLVVPLAEALAAAPGGEDGRRLAATVSASAAGLEVELRHSEPGGAEGQARDQVAAVALDAAQLRRRLQRLQRSPASLALRNEIVQLARVEAREARRRARGRGGAPTPQVLAALGRLPRLREVQEGVARLERQVDELEELGLLALLEDRPPELRDAEWSELLVLLEPAAVAAGRARLSELLLALYRLRFPRDEALVLGVYGEDPGWLIELTAAYQAHARATQAAFTRYRVVAGRDPLTGIAGALVESVPPEWDPAGQEGLLGLVFALRGPLVTPRFAPEQGLHALRVGGQERTCLVHVSEGAVWPTPAEGTAASRALREALQGIARRDPIGAIKHWREAYGCGLREAKDAIDALREGRAPGYAPPPGVHRKGALGREPRRRHYDRDALRIVDERAHAGPRAWEGQVAAAVAEGVEASLLREVEAQVVE